MLVLTNQLCGVVPMYGLYQALRGEAGTDYVHSGCDITRDRKITIVAPTDAML